MLSNLLQVSLAEFKRGTKVFQRKRLKLGPVLLAYENEFLSIESGEVTAVMNATGEWHGRAMLSKLCYFLQVKPGDLLVVVEQGKLFDADYAVAPSGSAYPVTTETVFTGNEILREPARKP